MNEDEWPADWQALSTPEGEQVLTSLGFDHEVNHSFATDYLTEEERRQPSVSASIRTLERMRGMVDWLIRDDHGETYGYWRGENHDIPRSQAPIVQFDTEGQFRFMAGTTLAEVLAVEYAWGTEERYLRNAARLTALGIKMPETMSDAIVEPSTTPTPMDVLNRIFREELVQASMARKRP